MAGRRTFACRRGPLKARRAHSAGPFACLVQWPFSRPAPSSRRGCVAYQVPADGAPPVSPSRAGLLCLRCDQVGTLARPSRGVVIARASRARRIDKTLALNMSKRPRLHQTPEGAFFLPLGTQREPTHSRRAQTGTRCLPAQRSTYPAASRADTSHSSKAYFESASRPRGQGKETAGRSACHRHSLYPLSLLVDAGRCLFLVALLLSAPDARKPGDPDRAFSPQPQWARPCSSLFRSATARERPNSSVAAAEKLQRPPLPYNVTP